MNAPTIEILDTSAHDRSQFDSGEPSLDTWLRTAARQAADGDGAKTYVTCDGGVILGYYSLASYQVETAAVPKRLRGGGYPVPAILLARLAVDRTKQGQGLGSFLLLDALRVAALVADNIGARIMVVHALNSTAANFYLHYGFQRFEGDDRSLFLPMQDIRLTLKVTGLR